MNDKSGDVTGAAGIQHVKHILADGEANRAISAGANAINENEVTVFLDGEDRDVITTGIGREEPFMTFA